MNMNIELSNLRQADRVLSVLSSKGISKDKISVVAPTASHFMALTQKQYYDDNEEVMMFAWLSAIVGSAFFTILTFAIIGLFSFDQDVNIDFRLMSVLALFGIFVGGVIGFLFGHALGAKRTMFKSKKIPRHPINNNVVLKFPVSDLYVDELEVALQKAKPLVVKCT
jgi:hypothetical protein